MLWVRVLHRRRLVLAIAIISVAQSACFNATMTWEGQGVNADGISVNLSSGSSTLSISPSSGSVLVSGKFTFSASGGTAPYTFAILSGTGLIAANTGNFRAGGAAGATTVQVTDFSGKTATTSVTVYNYSQLSIYAGSLDPIGSLDGIGNNSRFYYPSAVASDGVSIFVADTQNSIIRKISVATGMVTTLAGTPGVFGVTDGTGTGASFNRPSAIALDSTNTYLYVADTYNQKIRKINVASGAVTTVAGGNGVTGSTNGVGTAARFNNPFGIAVDSNYVYVADTYNYTIRKIDITTTSVTVMAGLALSPGSIDGASATARFNFPQGLTSDGTNLYVADTGNNKIRQVNIGTGVTSTLAGSGSNGYLDNMGALAMFNQPMGLTNDGTYLYVGDAGNNMIRKVMLGTGTVTSVAGTTSPGLVDNSSPTGAQFNSPRGLVFSTGNLYVADFNNHVIRKIQSGTGSVTTAYGLFAGAIGSSDGVGTSAKFNYAAGIVSDDRYMYVADYYNHTIRTIDNNTGAVTTLAGQVGNPGTVDGTGTSARFSNPYGMTQDAASIYVSASNAVRKVNKFTGAVTTVAGTGTAGSVDGPAATATFSNALGMVQVAGTLYVADSTNSSIRKIDLAAGTVSTYAGLSGSAGFTDGPVATARFGNPVDIASDGLSLYVADTGYYTIRKITIATGIVTTIAGTAGIYAHADGVGATARFKQPNALAIDATGQYLYVLDPADHTVRRLDTASGAVVTVSGSIATVGDMDGSWSGALFNFPAGIAVGPDGLYVTGYRGVRRAY